MSYEPNVGKINQKSNADWNVKIDFKRVVSIVCVLFIALLFYWKQVDILLCGVFAAFYLWDFLSLFGELLVSPLHTFSVINISEQKENMETNYELVLLRIFWLVILISI